MRVPLLIGVTLSFINSCFAQSPEADDLDPNIVIVNIEEGDRVFIGDLIRKVSACNPKVIGIDVWFEGARDAIDDKALQNALKSSKNEVLAYSYAPETGVTRSHRKFSSYVDHEGLAIFHATNDVATHFTPRLVIGEEIHDHFSLKIAQQWDPDLKLDYQPDERVEIQYTRSLKGFDHLDGSVFNSLIHRDRVEGKIVLLGYIGPSSEDKHLTPMNEDTTSEAIPDTYGVVIIANEIITLLQNL